jgi:hypothetical protein
MNIDAIDFELKMSQGELWSLAFWVKHSLEFTLKDHWVRYQDVWKEREKQRLAVINRMFLSLGRPDLYNDIFETADNVFKTYNASKTPQP